MGPQRELNLFGHPATAGLALGLLLLTSTASAQISMSFAQTGPTVTEPGLPFQGERTTHTTQRLADGSTIQREEHEMLARDSDGRFIDQSQPRDARSGTNPKSFYILADPTQKRVLGWVTGAVTATSYPLPATTRLQVRALPPPNNTQPNVAKDKKTVTIEQLGTKTFAGLQATGVRTIITIAADAIGNTTPLVETHDVWTNADLHFVVAEEDDSPFTGRRHMELTRLTRTAPDPDAFALPVGMTLRASTNPGLSPAFSNLVYQRLLQEIIEPETREKAADGLVAWANAHPETQSHIAHTLAVRQTHLDDAERLAHLAVDRLEQQSGAVAGSPVVAADLKRMEVLAEDWDSLGWVEFYKGDLVAARRYCQDAWQVGGEGLYLSHVAKLDEKAGDKVTAAHLYAVALSGKLDDRETEAIKKSLDHLGITAPISIAEPTVVTIQRQGKTLGTADLYLVFVKGQTPRVQWLDQAHAMPSEQQALQQAVYPEQIPDDGVAHVVRKANLSCVESGCSIHLLYAWEAAANN